MVLRFSRWHLSLALRQAARSRVRGKSPGSRHVPSRHALAGYEADELGHALLHRLLRVLRNLGVGRQGALHNATVPGEPDERRGVTTRRPTGTCAAHARLLAVCTSWRMGARPSNAYAKMKLGAARTASHAPDIGDGQEAVVLTPATLLALGPTSRAVAHGCRRDQRDASRGGASA